LWEEMKRRYRWGLWEGVWWRSIEGQLDQPMSVVEVWKDGQEGEEGCPEDDREIRSGLEGC